MLKYKEMQRYSYFKIQDSRRHDITSIWKGHMEGLKGI